MHLLSRCVCAPPRTLVLATSLALFAACGGGGGGSPAPAPRLSFGAPVYFTTGGAPAELQFADLDADGRLDALVADAAAGSLAFLAGSAAGFAAAVRTPTGFAADLVAAGDFDRDHDVDVV